MATTKLKKVLVQDVKILQFILIICLSFIGNAQKISGLYKQSDLATLAKDTSVEYEFNEGTFKKIENLHLNQKMISGGVFSFSGDTLILSYKKFNNNNNNNKISTAKVIREEKLNSAEVLETKISAENFYEEKIPAVIFVLQSKDKTPVMAFISNSEGNFPDINLYDNYIKYFKFSYLSGDDFIISTDSIFGYSTKIKIQINDSGQNYKNEEYIQKYIVIKLGAGKLKLQSLKNPGDTTILKKVKS